MAEENEFGIKQGLQVRKKTNTVLRDYINSIGGKYPCQLMIWLRKCLMGECQNCCFYWQGFIKKVDELESKYYRLRTARGQPLRPDYTPKYVDLTAHYMLK